jgi:hypothetical protein
MRQRFLVIVHCIKIAHVEPAEIIFTNVRRAGLAFARFDRNLGFRAVTCPLDRAQDTSLRFIREQLQQLNLFLVRLLESEFPISQGAAVAHSYSTPTNAAEQESSTIRVICSSGARRLWRVSGAVPLRLVKLSSSRYAAPSGRRRARRLRETASARGEVQLFASAIRRLAS